MVVEPGLHMQGSLRCLPPPRACACRDGAHTLGNPEAGTACNQIAFLPTELMLLREWKFAPAGGGGFGSGAGGPG